MTNLKDLRGAQTIELAGKEVRCYFFGENNYSAGMNPFTVNPNDITVNELLTIEGVHVNPFQKADSLSIFCLAGTQAEFDEWYQEGMEAYVTQEAVRRLGISLEMLFHAKSEDLKAIEEQQEITRNNFKPWYKK